MVMKIGKMTRMFSRRLSQALCLAALLSFWSPLSAYASEDAQPSRQEETLETLGNQMRLSLGSLKARCQTLTAELEEQSEKVKELRTKLGDLSTCLTNTNNTLCDYETKLIVYEQKLKARAKVIWILGILFAINALGKVAVLGLRLKGIKLPELFNILW